VDRWMDKVDGHFSKKWMDTFRVFDMQKEG
jgi:hypothetical protein